MGRGEGEIGREVEVGRETEEGMTNTGRGDKSRKER